ncbi:MAG: TetR/AcrR family transcriptional regulator [Alphaproteobacteria bacterium]
MTRGLRRSRQETQARILAAVGTVLARDGFQALGVNALAREAEVDKVLIYRYFGDLDGLIAAYAEAGDFWYRPEDVLPALRTVAPEEVGPFVGALFQGHLDALLARPLTLEILAWETVERNGLTAALEAVREERALILMDRAAACLPPGTTTDLAAFSALMGAATNYLAIRSRMITTFNGLDIRSAEGRTRMTAMIGDLAQALFNGTVTPSHPASEPHQKAQSHD